MRGIPKHIATKQDYFNLIDMGYDIRVQLEQLLSTATQRVDVQKYPEGYGEAEYQGEAVEPIFEEQPDPNGKIFRIGWTVEEVEKLLSEQEAQFGKRP